MSESLLDIQADAYRRLGALNVSAFLGRAADYSRGGLPGQSMSDGRGGGSKILGFDKVEQVIRNKKKAYEADLREINKLVRHMQVLESWMLEVAEAVPDEPIYMCDNLACTNPLEQGFKKGSCGRCRTHKSRYGLEWPHKSSKVTGLRQTAVAEMTVIPLCDNPA